MSDVAEIITAVSQLSPTERWDIYQWLNESPDIAKRRLDELRQEVGVGLAQAEQGDLAPLDMAAIKGEMHVRLASARGR